MDAFNSWLTVITNIGIIAGLVFVGLEYRQNSHMVEIGSSANISSQVNDIVDIAIQDPSLVELMGKDVATLTTLESDRLTLMGVRMLMAFDANYRDIVIRHGEDRLASATLLWRSIYHRPRLNYGVPHAWPTFKARVDTPFVTWFETDVVSARPAGQS